MEGWAEAVQHDMLNEEIPRSGIFEKALEDNTFLHCSACLALKLHGLFTGIRHELARGGNFQG